MFSAWTKPDGSPSVDGILEISALLGTIYWNRRADLEALIANRGGGTLRAYQFDQTSMPPSWTLIEQGNRLILSFTGTVNAGHLVGDITGIFADNYAPFGCWRHSYFGAQWDNLRNTILNAAPANWRNYDWSICGHSMGAAIALVAAFELARNVNGTRVDHFGHSLPKPFTRGYNSTRPTTSNFMAVPGDLVCYTPPNLLISVVTRPNGAFQAGIPVDWQHYSNGYFLDQFGRLTHQDPQEFTRPIWPWELAELAYTHPVRVYMGHAYWHWFYNHGNPDLQWVADLVRTIKDLPSVQSELESVNTLASVNIPFVNVNVFDDSSEQPVTPANLSSVGHFAGGFFGLNSAVPILPAQAGKEGTMTAKLTFFYSERNAGFSETWYLAGMTASNVPQQAVKDYITKRMLLSGDWCICNYVRLSTVGVANDVVTLPVTALFNGSSQYGKYGASQDTDLAGVALIAEKKNGGKKARIYIRGIPDTVVERGGEYRPTATYTNNFNDFAAFLKFWQYQWKAAGANVNAPGVITAAVQNPDGTILFTLGTNLFQGVAVDTHAVVRISGQVQPRYINGVHTIIVRSANTAMTLRPTVLGNFEAGAGRMILRAPAYITLDTLTPIKVRTRKTGRPFGVSRGRAPNRIRG